MNRRIYLKYILSIRKKKEEGRMKKRMPLILKWYILNIELKSLRLGMFSFAILRRRQFCGDADLRRRRSTETPICGDANLRRRRSAEMPICGDDSSQAETTVLRRRWSVKTPICGDDNSAETTVHRRRRQFVYVDDTARKQNCWAPIFLVFFDIWG